MIGYCILVGFTYLIWDVSPNQAALYTRVRGGDSSSPRMLHGGFEVKNNAKQKKEQQLLCFLEHGNWMIWIDSELTDSMLSYLFAGIFRALSIAIASTVWPWCTSTPTSLVAIASTYLLLDPCINNRGSQPSPEAPFLWSVWFGPEGSEREVRHWTHWDLLKPWWVNQDDGFTIWCFDWQTSSTPLLLEKENIIKSSMRTNIEKYTKGYKRWIFSFWKRSVESNIIN